MSFRSVRAFGPGNTILMCQLLLAQEVFHVQKNGSKPTIRRSRSCEPTPQDQITIPVQPVLTLFMSAVCESGSYLGSINVSKVTLVAFPSPELCYTSPVKINIKLN